MPPANEQRSAHVHEMILHHPGLPAEQQRSDQVGALPADEQRSGHIHGSPPANEQRSVIEIELIVQDWKRHAGRNQMRSM